MNSLYITTAMYPFFHGIGDTNELFSGYRYIADINKSLGHVYLYGTQLSLNSDKSADFYNPLMPSGSVVYRWDMAFSFTTGHAVAPMPLLKKNHQYQITLHAQLDDQQGLDIRILSFDYYNTLIDNKVIKGNSGIFTYPENAYFYTIELINVGMTKMHFKRVDIVAINSDKKSQDIANLYQKNIQRQQNNLTVINHFLVK